MIDFQPITPQLHSTYAPYLEQAAMQGCEYSFVNQFLWGQQKAAIVKDCLVVFAQYGRSSVYLYPMGEGDKKKALDAVLEDAAQRGINCRLAGMTDAEKQELQRFYPDIFCYHCDRDDFDYVYSIELKDDTVTTKEGVYIGMAKADVVSAYGSATNETEAALVYEKDACQLAFILEDGLVKNITYTAITE